MKAKILISILGSVFYFTLNKAYLNFRGILEANVAVDQLKDSDFAHFTSNLILDTNVPVCMLASFLGFMGVIWVPSTIRLYKKHTSN